MKHYGKECNYYFDFLKDDNYDVFFSRTKEDDEKFIPIPETSNHFQSIDSCITWATYWIESQDYKPKWYCCKIQDPDKNIVKQYFDYDSLLEDLWRTFIDVNMDEDEYTEQNWFIFPKGTYKEYIWHWFDERHGKGVHWLLYEMEDCTDTVVVNLVLDEKGTFIEYEFSSFSELIENVDNGTLGKDAHINTLYYKDQATDVEIDWNNEELAERGYTTISDVYNTLMNNMFIIS